MNVGQSFKRVDAIEKVTGRAEYTADLVHQDALVAKVLHAEVAHGRVLDFDLSKALAISGVVRIVTCFDIPKNYYQTAGHPYHIDGDTKEQDRLILEEHVRYYGDPIAAVIARDEISAKRAIRAIKVTYEEYPFYLDPLDAMQPEAMPIQERYDSNIAAYTHMEDGDFEQTIKEDGLIYVSTWHETPVVQHTFIENHGCYAYMEKGRIVVVSSTQIPHIVQQVVGQALGCPWGQIRVIKPYVGGGFGGKQDALYEPLCAYLTTVVGGRKVHLEMTREESYMDARVRHAIKYRIESWLRKDGTVAAKRMTAYSAQGGYLSHGHTIGMKGAGAFPQMYISDATVSDTYTIFTNTPAAGAMRGYGMPQFTFAMESHMDECARKLDMDPIALRKLNMMPVGFKDEFSGNTNFYPSYAQCMEKGMSYMHWNEKRALYKNQTGPVRRGVGMALFLYTTGAYPFILEMSSCRMLMNQDGTIQVQVGETEIGQGADTAFSQMAADSVGVPMSFIHVVTEQDTDITPFGLGAYASRQSYMAGKAIYEAGQNLREKILDYAAWMLDCKADELDLIDGVVRSVKDPQITLSLEKLAISSYYSTEKSGQLSSEASCQIKEGSYTFGCCFAEVEVDIPLCKAKVVDMINVHDCGSLINPALAKAQVHGGMSMAIGYGLSEELKFDAATGRILNGNLLDYKVSTTMDHPHLEAQFVENPEPTHPFGVKGLGEPPAIPGAAAIRNAILNATGVGFDKAPITSERMYDAFIKAGLIKED